MLNPNLDAEALAQQYAADQRLRVTDLLLPEVAQRLQGACRDEAPFDYLCHVDGKNRVIKAAEMRDLGLHEARELQEKIVSAASEGVGFLYGGFQIGNADRDPGNEETAFLHEVFDFLGSDEMLSFIATVTGLTDLRSVDAQYTRYMPGQFLTRHKDDITSEARRVAFVIGLSERWHPDWGGLLQFFDDDGTPRDAWTPAFNTLALFDVRHVHSVTYVTPFAREPRLSLTGWFRALAN